ncbi:MAG: alpha/beta hydrolase [Gammaproteobacteria bacterium]|jgi:hypothetical protein|nr:alpha/beta hydrolase [Gammaproteobacteria bacterium]
MSEYINRRRRYLLGAAGVSLVTARVAIAGSPRAASTREAWQRSDAVRSFTSLKQIDAGVLNIAYVDAGDPRGRPVVLLHGWPRCGRSGAQLWFL